MPLCSLQRSLSISAVLLALSQLTAVLWPCAAAADRPYAGRPVVAVLEELRAAGLGLIYNEQLVPQSLRVTLEPAAAAPVTLLEEILAPHGLRLSRVADSVYAIVSAGGPEATAPPDAPAIPPAAPLLDQIVVTTSRYALAYEQLEPNTFLTQAEVASLPKLGDETLRAVHRLPGAASDGISGLAHMRGGEEEETQIVLNGLPLYEPFHLKNFLGPVSVLDSRVIQSIDVLSGGYTAEHGDRSSAIIEARTLDPPEQRYRELGLSLFHANALLSDRFSAGSGGWLVALRRSNLEQLAQFIEKDFGHPEYADGFAQLSLAPSADTRLTFNVLGSRDSIVAIDSGGREHSSATYGNLYLWGQLEHDWSKVFNDRLTLSMTDLDNDRGGRVLDPGRQSGTVDDQRDYRIFGLRYEADHRLPQMLNRWGIEAKSLRASYLYSSSVQFEADFPFAGDPAQSLTRTLSRKPDGFQYAAYVTSRFRPAPRLVAELGLRWDEQTYGADDDAQLSPRANLLYELRAGTRLRASWGRYFQAQGINELQVEDGEPRFSAAQRAEHLILGLEQDLPAALQLRIEVYSKDYAHLRPRYENLFDPLVLLPELRPDRVRVQPQSAQIKGLETMLSRRTAGPWNWWLSYTWSQADDIIDGEPVPRSWDQRHAIQGALNWTGKRWDLTVAGTWHSGWPTTRARLVRSTDADGQPVADVVLEPRNAARFADFESLDLRASRRFALSHGELVGFVELTNALARRNPCCVQYSTRVLADGSVQLDSATSYWLELVPSLGVLWKY